MITGDQVITAVNVSRACGLVDSSDQLVYVDDEDVNKNIEKWMNSVKQEGKENIYIIILSKYNENPTKTHN